MVSAELTNCVAFSAAASLLLIFQHVVGLRLDLDKTLEAFRVRDLSPTLSISWWVLQKNTARAAL